MDVDFIGQLVDSMEDGLIRLERAIEANDEVNANKLRVFVFDIHKKIAEALRA